MRIIEILEKKTWNNSLKNIVHSNFKEDGFLQSFEWGEFQKKMGRKIWRLAVYENHKIAMLALVVKRGLPLDRSYLYLPQGPIFKGDGICNIESGILQLLEKIKEIAKQEKAIFWRIEPIQKVVTEKIKDLGYRSQVTSYKTVDVQPSKTTILDLKKSEEGLLAEMHPKTRYNIRLSGRHGVKVYESSKVEKFLNLLRQTSRRDKFKPYPDEYYRRLLDVDSKFAKLYLAEYRNKILAANIFIFFGRRITYLHGASSNQCRKVMAPYLLHWRVITLAKRAGYSHYDFWGIDEKKWPGLTRFKKGFGGREAVYPGTHDLPISNFWYSLYRTAKRIL